MGVIYASLHEERERERRGSGLGRAANSYVCKEEAASYSGLIGEE